MAANKNIFPLTWWKAVLKIRCWGLLVGVFVCNYKHIRAPKDITNHSKENSVSLNFYVLQGNATSTSKTLTQPALQKDLNTLVMTSSVTRDEVLLQSILPFFFGTSYFPVTLCKKN